MGLSREGIESHQKPRLPKTMIVKFDFSDMGLVL